jgi:glycosyltransferase involved in cell wall biosynthesis
VADLARELTGRGHEASLLQAFPDAGLPGFEGTRVVVHSQHWRSNNVRRLRNHVEDVIVPFRRTVRELIVRQQPDVIHTHNLSGLGTAMWEDCRRLRMPVVHTLHDYYLLCPRVTLTTRDGRPCHPGLFCGLRSQRLGRHGGSVGDVIGVSRYVLDRQAHVFPRARQHVIRNPATVTRAASSQPREQLRTIGYIGALERVKGVHVLLQAAPELARRGCTLVLAGGGRLEPEVQAAAARGVVRFVGRVAGPAKTAFFDGCDLGVVPSLWDEPAPYTPLEWLSSERPVLVSVRGGVRELIDSWLGAIAVEPTPQGIVAAVESLLEPSAWHQAVSRLRRLGSPEAMTDWVDAHEALYTTALAASPRRRRRTVVRPDSLSGA